MKREGKDGNKIFYTYNHLDIVLDIIRLEEDKKNAIEIISYTVGSISRSIKYACRRYRI